MADTIFIEGTGCECDVTIDTWLKDALPHLPGAVRSVAVRELVLTAREFFERSLAWTATISNVDAKANGVAQWTSPFDEYANVVAILGVTFNGNVLTPLSGKPAKSFSASLPTNYYITDAPDAFALHPTLPSKVDAALEIKAALTPKQSVEHLPRIAAIKFYDAIMDGFLARMMMHPRKPYTEPAMAAVRRSSFIAQIGRYRAQAKQGFAGAQGWAYPPTFGVDRHRSGGG